MTTTETVSGVVEARNDRGIRVNGEWLNQSKFHPVELPEVGATVRVGLDLKGFITTLEVVDQPKSMIAGDSAILVSRDQTITRLAVLKAAANFGASRPDLKSADVLAIADRWLAWVEQESAS